MKRNDYLPAPSLNRLIAYLIDWYITSILVSLAISIVQSVINDELMITTSIVDLELLPACMVLLLGLILVMAYFTYPLLLKRYDGQTIGKYLMGIKVIRSDGGPMTLRHYILRYFVGLILIEENLNQISFVFRSVLSLVVPHIIVEIIYYLGIIICIISIILVFTKKHKMIHDYISKTEVVRVPKAR